MNSISAFVCWETVRKRGMKRVHTYLVLILIVLVLSQREQEGTKSHDQKFPFVVTVNCQPPHSLIHITRQQMDEFYWRSFHNGRVGCNATVKFSYCCRRPLASPLNQFVKEILFWEFYFLGYFPSRGLER